MVLDAERRCGVARRGREKWGLGPQTNFMMNKRKSVLTKHGGKSYGSVRTKWVPVMGSCALACDPEEQVLPGPETVPCGLHLCLGDTAVMAMEPPMALGVCGPAPEPVQATSVVTSVLCGLWESDSDCSTRHSSQKDEGCHEEVMTDSLRDARKQVRFADEASSSVNAIIPRQGVVPREAEVPEVIWMHFQNARECEIPREAEETEVSWMTAQPIPTAVQQRLRQPSVGCLHTYRVTGTNGLTVVVQGVIRGDVCCTLSKVQRALCTPDGDQWFHQSACCAMVGRVYTPARAPRRPVIYLDGSGRGSLPFIADPDESAAEECESWAESEYAGLTSVVSLSHWSRLRPLTPSDVWELITAEVKQLTPDEMLSERLAKADMGFGKEPPPFTRAGRKPHDWWGRDGVAGTHHPSRSHGEIKAWTRARIWLGTMGYTQTLVEARPSVLETSPISEYTVLYRRAGSQVQPVTGALIGGCYHLGTIQQIETRTAILRPKCVRTIEVGGTPYEVCLLEFVAHSTRWTANPFRRGAQVLVGERPITRGAFPAELVTLRASETVARQPSLAALPGEISRVRLEYSLLQARAPERMAAYVSDLRSEATGLKDLKSHKPVKAVEALFAMDRVAAEAMGEHVPFSLTG